MNEVKAQRLAQRAVKNTLNEQNFFPVVSQGQVTLGKYALDDESYQTELAATDEELSELGFQKGYVAAHPEGSDRGGYVPTIFCESGAYYYDEGAGEWGF